MPCRGEHPGGSQLAHGRGRLADPRDTVQHHADDVPEVQPRCGFLGARYVGIDVKLGTGRKQAAERLLSRYARVNALGWPQNRPTIGPLEDHADVGMSANDE
jgi:hypothetical protein